MGGVLRNALFRGTRVANQVAGGECHELQLGWGKKSGNGWRGAKFRDAVGAQLYTTKADGSDIFDRLAIIPAPGDRRIAEMNFGRRWSYRRVEVRQIHGRIERLACEKG